MSVKQRSIIKRERLNRCFLAGALDSDKLHIFSLEMCAMYIFTRRCIVVQEVYCGSGGVMRFRMGIAVFEGYCGSRGVLRFRRGIVVQEGYCGSGRVLRFRRGIAV